MLSGEIPEDLRDFILKQIDLIAHLEALLLLRSNAGQDWTAAACGERLYLSESEAGAILGSLAESGFLSKSEDRYQFSCKTTELEEMVVRLAELYREKLIPVTNLIHSNQNRVREFADAFKLRKDT